MFILETLLVGWTFLWAINSIYEDIDREFEIRLMDDSAFVVRETRRAMLNRIQNMSSFFLPVLSPNPQDLHSLVEMGAFNKKEKGMVDNNIRSIMNIVHHLSGISIKNHHSSMIPQLLPF